MSDPPDNQRAARAWLDKADGDRRSARALLDLSPPETESAAFHCQQAAEKYLKAFLAYHGDDIPRIHDLTVLVDVASDYDSSIDELEEPAELLVPFAVAARYPFTHAEPDAAEAEDAFDAATTIRDAITSRIDLDE
jgi:HEPN domain-containing protein